MPLTLEPLDRRLTPAVVGWTGPTEAAVGQFLAPNSYQVAEVVAPDPVRGGGPVLQITDRESGRVLQTEFVLDPGFRGGLHVTTISGVAGGRVPGDGKPLDRIVVTGGPGAGDVVQILAASTDGKRMVVESTRSAHLGEDFRGGMKVSYASPQPFGANATRPLILLMPDSAGYAPRVVSLDQVTGEVRHSFFVGPPTADSTAYSFSELGGSFTSPRSQTVSLAIHTGPLDPVAHRQPTETWSFDELLGDFGRNLSAEFDGYDAVPYVG